MRPNATPSPSGPSIDPATRIGAVSLTVADLDRMRSFYERAIGLRTLERDGATVRLGTEDDRPLVELVGDPDAPPAPRRATGLFHQALLVPTRPELARSMKRLVESGWRLTGASDHLVSEALYLDDPEGNGIEIYRDRPRSEWRTTAGGEIEMATIALDLDGVMSALPGDPDAGAPPGTVMGHVHLRVSEIPPAEAFYQQADRIRRDRARLPRRAVRVRGRLPPPRGHEHLGQRRGGCPAARQPWAAAVRGAGAQPRGARGPARPSDRRRR